MRKLYAGMVLALLGMAVLATCGNDDRTAGGGINNPNTPSAGINGSVVAGGVPAPGAEVVLYRISHDDSAGLEWGAVDTVCTDDDGKYAFADAELGYYSLVCSRDGLAAFGGYFDYSEVSAAVAIPLELDTLKDLRISLAMKDSSSFSVFTASLVGTPFYGGPSRMGEIVIPLVPIGAYGLAVKVFNNGNPASVAEDIVSVPVTAGSDSFSRVDGCVVTPGCDAGTDTVVLTGGNAVVTGNIFVIEYSLE